MKDAVGMGPTAMIYVPSFIQIDSGIQELIGVSHRRTGWRSHEPTLESRLNA
jgi:hypothetical protein